MKKSLTELDSPEERFRLIIETVKDYAIFMLNPDGYVESWNEGARRLKGYEPFEIIGKHFSIFYPEDNKHWPEEELKIARRDGRIEDEGWRVRKDGSRFWANVIITRIDDEKGELIGFSKVTRDLTERKAAEEAIKRSEERLRMMVTAVKDYAIFMLDENGIVTSWNPGAKRIKGYEEEEIIGQSFKKFYTPEDIARKHPEHELKIAFQEGKYEEEGWRVKKDGSRFWAHVVINRVNDAQGNLIGYGKVTRDLSERKRAQEKLEDLNASLEERVKERTQELENALKVRDEFLAIAAHEFKTPLTPLLMQLQFGRKRVQTGKATTEELLNAFDVGVRQVRSLTNLVEDLLEISRLQSGWFELHPETMDINDLLLDLESKFKLQLQRAKIQVTHHLKEEIQGYWDRKRLGQVITNLFSNAMKYAPHSNLTIVTNKVNDIMSLSFTDSGPGIPIEKQKSIFDRYERMTTDRSISGLGLGLFISKRIVEAHGGAIELESEVGVGSTFRILLPLKTDQGEIVES